MSLFGSSSKENTLLVDIASSSVAVALVHNDKGKSPEIDFTIRLPINNSPDSQAGINQKMLLTLREALTITYKEGVKILIAKKRPKNINVALIGMSSLWYTSKLITKKFEDKEGVFLTQAVQKDYLKIEIENFKKELKENYKDDSEVFEASIIGVSANGYPVETWSNKIAASFDITFLLSGSPKNLINSIEEEIAKIFGIKKGISIHSINSVLSRIILDSFKNIHSALLVDISGYTTDLLYIHNGTTEKEIKIPFGITTLIKNIAENLNLPKEIAESMLSLYSSGLLDDQNVKELDQVFDEAEEEWALTSVLVNNEQKIITPQNIFIVSDTPYALIGKAILKDIFAEKEVTILNCQSGFLKACIGKEDGIQADGHLAVLGTYSQFLN